MGVRQRTWNCIACLRRPGIIACICLLPFLAGCFPKTVIQTPTGPPSQSISRSKVQEQLYAQYERWKGVPYRSSGEDGNGFDCSGLVRVVYRDAFRMDLPRTSGEQSRLGQPVNRDEIVPGDILYFIDRGQDHVGIAVEAHRFMHSSTSRGVMISELDGYWIPRLIRVRRIIN